MSDTASIGQGYKVEFRVLGALTITDDERRELPRARRKVREFITALAIHGDWIGAS
jgi:hypothetical protein